MASTKRNSCSAKLVLSVISIGLITITQAQEWVIDDDGCRTPRRGVGVCVLIKDCQPMLDILRQSQRLTQNEIELLRSYQCGYEGNQVKVCCPNGPILIKSPTTGTPPPPDVSNHRNINLLPRECGPFPNRERIINGNKTQLFEYPWMALISYDTGNGPDFRCGGSVISNRYILTAAHCITNLSTLKLLGVRVGEYNTSSAEDCEVYNNGARVCAPPVQDIRIARSIPHANYNPTLFTDDIGLIRLAAPINTNVDNAKPICLPTTDDLRNMNLSTSKLTVTGWGATETGKKSPDLLQVDIPVATDDNCKKAYEKTSAKISYKQLCAGGSNRRDSCAGDSGGPLQRLETINGEPTYVQHGIVSFGPRYCGQEGFPGVYTKISYYMDWILNNMEP